MFVGVSAVPVAVNDTDVSDGALTVSVFTPVADPSVQLPTVAVPAGSVVCVAPVTLPPPPETAKVTLTPETGFPCASLIVTFGAGDTVCVTTALPPSPAVFTMGFAG